MVEEVTSGRQGLGALVSRPGFSGMGTSILQLNFLEQHQMVYKQIATHSHTVLNLYYSRTFIVQ